MRAYATNNLTLSAQVDRQLRYVEPFKEEVKGGDGRSATPGSISNTESSG